jgi:hypothetical protein
MVEAAAPAELTTPTEVPGAEAAEIETTVPRVRSAMQQ